VKTLNKIIITKQNHQILTAVWNQDQVAQLNLEDEESESLLNNIYIGKVKNVTKNIDAAFIDLGGGQMAYYSLMENKRHLFASSPKDSAPEVRLRPGDEIVVQVCKDAIKTKDPVVTGRVSFTGRYCVVTAGRCHIGFSAKITDSAWKANMRRVLEGETESDFGIIIRTNAKNASETEILKELADLKAQYHKVLSEAPYRTYGTCLYKAVPPFIASLRDTYQDFMEEIVTDDKDIYRQIREYLEKYQPEDVKRVRLYQDPLLSLAKLYSLEKAVTEALQKKVWLKSGGYLIIEHTEAMTVIDVNSGKYTGKKNMRDTIRKINLEAAREIAFQTRLRNLSGMIIVDFIDMVEEEDQEELMDALTEWCRRDPIKTTVVDMTKLGLVEITRKKIRKPFREQVGKGELKK
jgi:Rne/Rng family ribonuclease